MPKHVVILGCGRSGTSIFGELFEGLGCYRYFFEPGWDVVPVIDYGAGPVAMKVPKAPIGTSMTAGLPFLLEEFLALVPEPRVLFWQVRHPLDTVCSLRPGIEAGWSHNPKPPDWQEWLDLPLVQRCARHWSYINGAGFSAVKSLCVVNRFEELVAAPLDSGRRACIHADVDIERHGAQIEAWAARVSNEKSEHTYEAKHQTRWSRLDHTVRTGRWRENLTEDEFAAVVGIVVEASRNFGYALSKV